MTSRPKGGIEQARRNLKAEDPNLYAYIAAHEVARALDSAGDEVSGARDGMSAANRVWGRAAAALDRKRALVEREALAQSVGGGEQGHQDPRGQAERDQVDPGPVGGERGGQEAQQGHQEAQERKDGRHG